jgi:hypothetical protein
MELFLSVGISLNMGILFKHCMKAGKVDKFVTKLIRFSFGRLRSSGEHRSFHTSGSASDYWALHQDGAE